MAKSRKKPEVEKKAEIPEYQQRVIDEKNDLVEKSTKLQAFLVTDTFRKLDKRDQNLLEDQHRVMGRYTEILAERISRF